MGEPETDWHTDSDPADFDDEGGGAEPRMLTDDELARRIRSRQ